MRNELGYDGDNPWTDAEDGAPIERVRGTTRLTDAGPKRHRQADPPIAPGSRVAIRDEQNEPLERVGRRHIIRPELGAVVLGVLFIFAALIKPWGAPVPGPSPSAPASAQDSFPPLFAVQGPQGQQVPPLPPDLVDLSRGWAGVDWSFLSLTDAHIDWGIATATMPEVTLSTPSPTPNLPSVNWIPVPTATPATVLDVGPNQGVFALAVTWPPAIRVSDITVEYLGSGYQPPYLTSGGFQPYTQLSPLRADSVLTPLEPATQGSPRAGEFWIPPAIASPVTADRSAAVAWHQLPWPWPLGGYKITVTTKNGPMTLPLFLRQTPGPPAELTPHATPRASLAP
jgi:hypothetical protein